MVLEFFYVHISLSLFNRIAFLPLNYFPFCETWNAYWSTSFECKLQQTDSSLSLLSRVFVCLSLLFFVCLSCVSLSLGSSSFHRLLVYVSCLCLSLCIDRSFCLSSLWLSCICLSLLLHLSRLLLHLPVSVCFNIPLIKGVCLDQLYILSFKMFQILLLSVEVLLLMMMIMMLLGSGLPTAFRLFFSSSDQDGFDLFLKEWYFCLLIALHCACAAVSQNIFLLFLSNTDCLDM